MANQRMTRRRFLTKATAAAGGLAVLGLGVQCGATPTPKPTEVLPTETPVVMATVPPEVTEAPETEVPLTAVGEKKLVRIIVSYCGITVAWGFVTIWANHSQRAARLFNDTHPGIEVQIEETPACRGDEGWVPKVISQIEEKKLDWCGTMPMFPFIHIASRAKSGMHVPLEDHIAASKESGADVMLDDMLPLVLADTKYEDHIYGIPCGLNVVTYNYHSEFWDAAGWERAPETWEELYSACADFKREHEGEEILPYGWTDSLHGSLHPYVHSATEKPYTEDGLLDFTGAGIECLSFMKTLVEAGFTPPRGSGDDLWVGFRKGEVGAALSDHVWTAFVGFHFDDYQGPRPNFAPPQSKVKGGGRAGTLFYADCASLFQNAPYPQELVDFLIWTFGPANTAMQKAIVIEALRKNPVYQSVYDEVIDKDPIYSDYVWMKDIVDMAAESVAVPRNEYWLPQARAYKKWAPQFFEEGSELTAEETAKNMLDEVKVEIAKME